MTISPPPAPGGTQNNLNPQQPGLNDCYQKSRDIVSRSIDGELFLVPIRQKIGDLDSIFSLTGTASRIWELVDGQRTLQDILDQVVVEFEVSREQALADLLELAHQLLEIGALERV